MSTSIILADERRVMQQALQTFSSAMSKLTDEQVPAALDMVKQLHELSEEMKDGLRARAIQFLRDVGQKVTDKGSLQTLIGGYRLTAVPTKTGLDPKKLEVALRRRGLDPTAGMNPTITYKVDIEKVAALMDSGKLTSDDIKTCQYDESFRVTVEPLDG